MRLVTASTVSLIPHVFLPLKLPGNASNIVCEESHLLSLFNKTIQTFDSKIVNEEDCLKNTKTTFKVWDCIQDNIDPKVVSQTVQALNEGENFALYLRAQNVGIIITIPPREQDSLFNEDEMAVFSTFPACQPSQEVTSSARDLAGVFPVTSVVIPKSNVINSMCFGRQLNALNVSEIFEAMPTTTKAGHAIAEVREAADPYCVSKWLTAALCNEDSKSSSSEIIPRVIKKVRDNIVFDDAKIPFRRSGLWMAAKVVLQICLTQDLGKADGYFVYKIILIKFMLQFVKIPDQPPGLMLEIMGKIARRSRKLQLVRERNNIQDWIDESYNFLMNLCADTLKAANKSLKTQWELAINKEKDLSEFNLREPNWIVNHGLTKSNFRQLLVDLQKNEKIIKLMKLVISVPPVAPRHREFHVKFNDENLETKDEHLGIVLYDFEKNVRYWDSFITELDTLYIWGVFKTYLDKGKCFYAEDPVGASRMILTCLKMIQVWDKIVMDKYPLLLDHRPGINLDFTVDLLLPNKVDMLLLLRIELYFAEREQRALLPSMIEESEVTINSFANRFAKSDMGMTQLKSRILTFSKEHIIKKLELVHVQRAKCEKLRTRIRSLECEYIVDHWKRKHSHTCTRCRLDDEERKTVVTVFEALLPVSDEGQNSVVFELLIPSQIAVLRDILFLFSSRIMGNIPERPNEDLYGPWSNYRAIANCNSREQRWIVDLMSTKKLVLQSHYKDLHPSNPDSDFIRQNGYNCHYAGDGKILGTKPNRAIVKYVCTLKVQKKSPYSSMQWAVDGHKYTPNEVLARQSECHNDLTLLEFIEFGSLRSLWNIQWRNIYRAFTQLTLSLKNESVYNLLNQTIWQAGPQNVNSNHFSRIAHQDFEDLNFTWEFLFLLEDIHKKHVDNWKDHYVLLTIIIFSQRIIALTPFPDVRDAASRILSKCRKVTTHWSDEIQRIVSQLTNAPRAEVDALRIKIVEVNVCCALTFRMDFGHFAVSGNIEPEVIKYWLLSVAKIHDNLVLIGQGCKIPINLRNLLRRVEETGVYLEPYLQDDFQTGILSYGLNLFVESHYPSSKIMDHVPSWICHDGDSHAQIYCCKICPKGSFGEETTLQMDVIKGRFLVDGSPVGYLPTKIENHPDFQRTFPTKSFEVQPYAFQPGRMITRDKFSGSAYSFYLKQDGSLLITEHFEEDNQRELITYSYFKDNVPRLLVKNYTHWWNFKSQRFEFFYRDLGSPSKLAADKPEYYLEVKNYLLIDFKIATRMMVDINCNGYRRILKIIERLESAKYVNIWYEKGERNQYIIDLPRMGLHFTFTNPNGTISLTSKEYRGMKVARNQTIETLVGLQHGLLIEDADLQMNAKKNSILLMPHGYVGLDYTNELTKINNHEDLRSPHFFAYEVDTQLKQLKAGESQAGWVFLAYLHAATSSPLPDPFTGVTGTERALQILQSGHCWSCEPFEEETVKTLRHIAELSPNRQYYPRGLKKMETVKWILAPQVSHDAFQLLVEKLLWDSERLQFLFKKGEDERATCPVEEPCIPFRSDRELCIRGYWRRLNLSTEQGRISPEFLDELQCIPYANPIFHYDINFKSDHMKNVLRMSQMCHSWTCNMPMHTAGLVKKLLFTGKDVKGVYEEGFPIKEAIDSWWRICFREFWLDLYVLARKVVRKKLEPEWTHLMTYFAFRQDLIVDFDQLLLLHTVAVYPEEFKSLDSPEFTEYYQTDEYAFNYQIILDILSTQCSTSWESFMDRHEDEYLLEDSLETFVNRLRPIHEELVATQSSSIADKIRQKWPLDCCDDIFSDLKDDEKSEIDCDMAKSQLNMMLKNWYRNRELYNFVSQVEVVVASLECRSKSHAIFTDTSKSIVRLHQKGNLDRFCEILPFTINLHSLLGARGELYIDEKSFDEAKSIFTRNKIADRKSYGSTNRKMTVPDFPLQLKDSCPILREYMNNLEESWSLFHKNSFSSGETIEYNLQQSNKLNFQYKERRQRALFFWEKIKEAINPRSKLLKDSVTKQLVFAELFPRVIPLNLLPIIKQEQPKEPFLEYLWTLLGAYGVLLTFEQQGARCVRYSQRGKNFQGFELQKELSHNGHENWNPAERRDWLLFEIEMDLMVRPIQAKVAERMENPENNENALVQLNMGEGKTSVIVPLLVLSLANGKRLCRATVLKSLYRINHTALISRIGGLLLNRRVYSFPCRRDKKMGYDDAEWMLGVYKECAKMGGVVLTLPEYRLSFELKAYEKCQANHFKDGRGLFHVQEWLKNNARDVLDESDEILHVKYQLIYTLGKQMPIEGGALRWTVLQGLLSLVPDQIEYLLQFYGSNYVEFKTRNQKFKFPYCRILKPDCFPKLCQRLASDIINGHSSIQIPEIPSDRKATMTKFLTQEQLDRNTFNEIFKWYPIQAHQEVLLILRGFLACGVLCTALSKRWRVNYGVNPTGYRRMAVPFRAKDVAAERTEFGHADVAIVLTELSYYYSGLNDEQLSHCFVILFLEPNPALAYDRWISQVPKTFLGYETIRHLSSVNLKDFTQKTKVLFPALRKNIATIDFWLSHVVFPQESKQFGFKIGCSPWDLCLDRNNRTHPTTGFSGTNDSKILLPKTITQKDLPELQGTNGEVLKNLLLAENNNYKALPLGFTGRQILDKLVDCHIRLLLDVGALMLELDNEQVAKLWLKLENDAIVDAAVYFDEYNKLVVIDRFGCIVSLEISTYRSRLDRCVIYLDDVHTRGTDLKIPPDTRGCVTLGKGVTKDKLVQGCMRMRMLGQRPGHRVVFWASQEVHNAILALVKTNLLQKEKIPIETKHVLQWSIMNNRDAIKDGFIHWASAGVYQAQKLSAQVLYNSSQQKDPDLFVLAESCAQKEQVDLKAMYGDVRSLEKFPTIVQHLLNRVNRELKKRLGAKSNSSLVKNIHDIVEFFGSSVREHSEKYVADVLRSTQLLDEEQERELEHELEAQHQKQKPAKARSQEHSTSLGVEQFILQGHLQDIDQWAIQIPLALKATTLWNFCPNDTWAPTTYASRDFATVIRSSASKSDKTDFLRPPNWLCSVTFAEDQRKRGKKTVVLLLSPWEVDYYIDYFRSGVSKAILHMFAPRISMDQDTLCQNVALAIPSVKLVEHFPSSINSALLMFSGSAYFANKEEQDEYCRFAGFCPRPRTKEEEEVFELGGLCDGFVAQEFRNQLGYGNCAFAKNPEQLIRKIVERRYGSFPMDCHVGKVVFQCKKPFQ